SSCLAGYNIPGSPFLAYAEVDMLPCIRRALLLAVAPLLILWSGWLLAVDKSDPSWINLLDGDDLSKHWATTGNWKLDRDGVLSLQPRPGEKGWQRYDAYLWSKKQYRDFEAQFEYKLGKRGNSGFYFHVGDKKSPVQKGLEVQLYDSH